jgi:hypothetical protein
MPKRTAKFASAAFVIILAGIPLATMTHGETAPPDGCLAAPKGETPPGSHWFYRVDHANKRNCWYLRSEGGQSQAAPQNASQVPSTPAAAKPSAVDAHAELRAQASREGGVAVSPAAAASSPANTQRSTPWPATPPVEAAPAAAAAPRWPEPAATNPAPSSAAPAAANPADNPPQATTDLPVAAAVSAPADPPAPIHLALMPGLIVAALGAMAFAIAVTVLIARRRRVRLPRHRKTSRARAPIWEMTDDDRIVLEDQAPSHNRGYEPRFARGVGSAKIQPAKMHPTKVQPAKAQPAKVQGAKVQAGKVQAPNVRGDRRTDFPPRMPRSASR